MSTRIITNKKLNVRKNHEKVNISRQKKHKLSKSNLSSESSIFNRYLLLDFGIWNGVKWNWENVFGGVRVDTLV